LSIKPTGMPNSCFIVRSIRLSFPGFLANKNPAGEVNFKDHAGCMPLNTQGKSFISRIVLYKVYELNSVGNLQLSSYFYRLLSDIWPLF